MGRCLEWVPMENNRRRKTDVTLGSTPPWNQQFCAYGSEEESDEEEDEDMPSPFWSEEDEEDEKQLDLGILESVLHASSPPPVFDKKQKGVVQSFDLKPLQKAISVCGYGVRGESSCALYPCVICKDDKPKEELIRGKSCDHFICHDCTQPYLAAQVNQICDVREFKCPGPKCKTVIEPNMFRSLVPDEVIDRWTAAIRDLRKVSYLRERPNLGFPGRFGDDFPCSRRSWSARRQYMYDMRQHGHYDYGFHHDKQHLYDNRFPRLIKWPGHYDDDLDNRRYYDNRDLCGMGEPDCYPHRGQDDDGGPQ